MTRHTYTALVVVILIILVCSGTPDIYLDLVLLLVGCLIANASKAGGALFVIVMMSAGAIVNILLCIVIIIIVMIYRNNIFEADKQSKK